MPKCDGACGRYGCTLNHQADEEIAALKAELDSKTCEIRGWEAGMAAVNTENAKLREALEAAGYRSCTDESGEFWVKRRKE